MLNVAKIPGIMEDGIDGGGEPKESIGLSQKQHTAIGGDVATGEFGFDLAALQGWKSKGSLGTVCHGRGSVRIQHKQLNYIELYGPCPFYL